MKALIAALKRNDRIAVTAEVLELMGQTEKAAEARLATRATVSFFDRSFADFKDEDAELDEQADLDITGPTYAESDVTEPMKTPEEVVDHSFDDIRKAIAKGKGKKAKKLCKAAKEAGARGSVLKDLTRQAKEL